MLWDFAGTEKKFKVDNARLDSRLKRSKKNMSAYGVIVFFLFIFFTALGLFLLRSTILNNSHVLGNEIASRANTKILDFIDKQKEVLHIVGHYAENEIERAHQAGESFDEKAFVKEVKSLVSHSFAPFDYTFYGCFDGKMVTSESNAKDCFLSNPHLEPKTDATYWYSVIDSMGMHERNKFTTNDIVLFLHNSKESESNKTIFTLATKINAKGDAIAFDFISTKSPREIYLDGIPDTYSYFLLDPQGQIILFHNDKDNDKPFDVDKAQIFVNSIFTKFIDKKASTEIFEKNLRVSGPGGHSVHVYAHHDEVTGWYTILTTPYARVLDEYNFIFNIFICIVTLFLVVEISMLYREFHLSRQIEMTNESLKVLGNSYNDIIRIDFNNKRFTLLKSTDRMRDSIGQSNDTGLLFDYFKKVLRDDEWESFYENYSLASQEHLSVNRIRDMGHDFMIMDPDGLYRWYNIRLLFDESMDINDSILAIKLVDEDKLLEIEQKQLLKDALAMSHKNEESKSIFFSNMSHDMRTPLNGIMGLCAMAVNHVDDKERTLETINKITTTSKQLLSLIDDILEIARPEQQLTLNREKFNLHQSLNECLDLFTAQAKQEQKTLKVNYELQHENLIGDFPKLRQILNNLISNSFKYSQHGATISFSVREVVEQHLPQFIFEIKDTGIGMTPEFLKNLYVPYIREERMSNVKGTGLGMPIVKNLVHKMCGNIHVTSALGVGTTFIVTIPFEIDTECAQAQNHQEPENAPAEIDASGILKGLRILVVEDNELNMEIAEDILSMKGAIISKAWNGREAVDVFTQRGNDFDVILMDMRMPVMDGLQATAAIRALKDNTWAQQIPIIAVTANAFAEDISATHATGMNAHVSKPIDFNILEKTLYRLIKKNKEL